MIKEEKHVTKTIIDGKEEIKETTKTTNYHRLDEPDYIKIYTRMWCEFNQIPQVYRSLFLELVTRMSYCNSTSLGESQIVYVGGSVKKTICNKLRWKDAMYYRGLKALVDCGAIIKKERSEYQINPSYAGKGEWMYNPRLQRGGVKDLIATFRMGEKGKTVKTEIVWADDGEDNELNKTYRKGLGVDESKETVLTHKIISLLPKDDEEDDEGGRAIII